MRIREIASAGDPAWAGWRAVYEESFPPHERMSVPFFERRLAAPPDGRLMLAAEGDDGSVDGILYAEPELGGGVLFLWYVAVRAGLRSRGLGRVLYGELERRAREAGAQGILLEVEMPALQEDREVRELAERRIGWYRRLGAKLLGGVEYFQTVDTVPEPTEMHLMYHPLGEEPVGEEPVGEEPAADPEAVFALVKGVAGESLRRVGPLSLE